MSDGLDPPPRSQTAKPRHLSITSEVEESDLDGLHVTSCVCSRSTMKFQVGDILAGRSLRQVEKDSEALGLQE
jgi:hypothetical protein